MKIEDLIPGKIYFFGYGGNTEVIGMIKSIDFSSIQYFCHLHYWNGFEKFHKEGYSLQSPIEEIREASKAEKHNLINNAIENEVL